MMQGTTPLHTFTLPFDTSLIAKVRITYAQNGKVVLQKGTEDMALSGQEITVRLTQRDTLAFQGGTAVQIQVRVLTVEDEALASAMMKTSVGIVLGGGCWNENGRDVLRDRSGF